MYGSAVEKLSPSQTNYDLYHWLNSPKFSLTLQKKMMSSLLAVVRWLLSMNCWNGFMFATRCELEFTQTYVLCLDRADLQDDIALRTPSTHCVQRDDIHAQHHELDRVQGFATVGANNGHNGTSGEPFYQHPEVIEDFVYRSLHTGVVVGKQLTKLFYPEGFKKSYYIGCSTGGRQGFKAVQEFPEEFDEVLAGAPAFNFINLLSWSAWFYTITGPPGADTFLTPAEWKIVHPEILRQCDGLDGAVDGIIEDPDLCHPIIETLICKPGENKDTCLTGTQAHTVRETLSPYYGENGTLLYPRMQPGSEIKGATALYSGTPFPYSTDWYRYVVYNDPTWDPVTFNVHDASVALAQNPFNVQTWESNLTAFRDAGSKVLTYHGLEDHLISSENSKLYYARVAETMNLLPSELDQFYRLFSISGMAHCDEGEGASAIGNELNTFTGTDPEDNVLMAVVKWVEEGAAPETVRGAKLVDGPGSAVEYRRKHCRYPRRNVFKGPGHYTDENAWHCV